MGEPCHLAIRVGGGCITTTLHHEVGYRAVPNRAIILLGIHIAEEVVNAERCRLVQKFHEHRAIGSLELNKGVGCVRVCKHGGQIDGFVGSTLGHRFIGDRIDYLRVYIAPRIIGAWVVEKSGRGWGRVGKAGESVKVF